VCSHDLVETLQIKWDQGKITCARRGKANERQTVCVLVRGRDRAHQHASGCGSAGPARCAGTAFPVDTALTGLGTKICLLASSPPVAAESERRVMFPVLSFDPRTDSPATRFTNCQTYQARPRGSALAKLTVVTRKRSSNDRFAMERIHLNLSEWVATWSAKAEFRLTVVSAGLKTALQLAHRTVTELAYRVKRGHWRLQEAFREQENNLTKLLADSIDPIVVTDDSHRVLAANPAALDLLGVSRANICKFTIDAFLPHDQVHCFERAGPPFIKCTEKLGECIIIRLDGRSKVMEYTFQANFVLGRHLSKFRDSHLPCAGESIAESGHSRSV